MSEDQGDFELGPPPEEEPPLLDPEEPASDGPPPILFAGVGLVVAVVAFGAYLLLRGGEPAEAPQTRQPVSTRPAAPVPATPTPEPLVLPGLDASDELVRRLAASLSSRPELAAWLATDHIVRKFVVAVDNVADGASPARSLRSMAPEGEFAVAGDGGSRVLIDPRSYQRYDAAAAVVGSLDAAGCVRLYRQLRPLVDEAYRELGYPDRDFDDTLRRALKMLVEAPVPVGDVEVLPRVVSYRFADPRLEALPDAQKHLVRMGARNAGLVQAKLREIAAGLEPATGADAGAEGAP